MIAALLLLPGPLFAPPPSLIGFRFTLARPEPRIAPTFIAVYDADWVVPPTQ